MKKNLFYVGVLLLSTSLFAQVGINTETPGASLEIAKDPNVQDGFTNGGLILGYPGESKNTVAYSVAGVSDLLNQEILVRDKGTGKVNYMNRYAIHTAPMRPSNLPIIGTNTVIPEDHTILVRADMTLPTGDDFAGKIIYLVYDSQSNKPFVISGPIKDNSYLNADYTSQTSEINHKLILSPDRHSYVLQYRPSNYGDGHTGTWVVIGGMERQFYRSTEMVTLYDDGKIKRDDKYVLVKGNLTLPDATAHGNIKPLNGNLITLAYNGNGTEEFTVTAGAGTAIDIGGSGGSVPFITLKNEDGKRTYKLFYDGSSNTWRLPHTHARR